MIQRKSKLIWSRSSIIPKFLVGISVKVHNGKEFKTVQITEDKVGYKFGEFSTTRKRRQNVLSSKNKQKQKKKN
jgi:small subunit ribosomal protein S19